MSSAKPKLKSEDFKNMNSNMSCYL